MAKGRKPAPRRGKIITLGPGEIVLAGEGGMSAAPERKREVWITITDDIGGNRPGRPSSISIIREEAQRRLVAGNTPGTLKELANALSSWLNRHHPDEPAMRPRVVEKNISDLWKSRRR